MDKKLIKGFVWMFLGAFMLYATARMHFGTMSIPKTLITACVGVIPVCIYYYKDIYKKAIVPIGRLIAHVGKKAGHAMQIL